MRKTTFICIAVFILLILSACNLPVPATNNQDEPQPDLALTITAQALLLTQSGEQPAIETPIPDPVSSSTPELTSTPKYTATTEFTAISSIPLVKVSVDTNCRLGPGVAYKAISALTIEQEAQIVGKNSFVPNYWVINNPSGSGTCWLWGQYATVTGDTSGLQEYAVPPTPTPTIGGLKAVENLSLAKTCDLIALTGAYIYRGTLTWDDRSDNEDGFNLYINDTFAEALPPNTTSYTIPVFANAGGTEHKFGIEPFNAAGKGTLKQVIFVCP